mmetsp:Transcript_41867/g.76068  ORF Transcript_41867/g.76068 Transcript_41867/m.76068 type:complete len:557 (+) Transcript_41867:85-1755(+)
MQSNVDSQRCNRTASSGSTSLQAFYDKGWKEAQVLGIGAGGPVKLVRLPGPRGDEIKSVLKRSTATEVLALQALAQCRNIVQLEEHLLGTRDTEVWVRLEWLKGGSLREALRAAGGTLTEDRACHVVAQVLYALRDIHKIGWMHRDVKAENIGVSTLPIGKSTSVKLLDFDTAIQVPTGQSLHDVVGTVENMAPEVYEGSYNELADCWSLGIVAHEALFGYRPFNDCSIDRIEEMVRNWQQYLLLPSGSQPIINLIGQLLRGREDRLSSEAAARHPWVISGTTIAPHAANAAMLNSFGSGESISNSPTPVRNAKPRGSTLEAFPPSSTAAAAPPIRRDAWQAAPATPQQKPEAVMSEKSGLTPVPLQGDEFEQHSVYLKQVSARAAELKAAAVALTSEAATSAEQRERGKAKDSVGSTRKEIEATQPESISRTSTASSTPAGDSSVEAALLYLQGVREKNNGILQRLSAATAGSAAASEERRSSAPSAPAAALAEDRRSSVPSAPTCRTEAAATVSPRSHLAMQRRRTESLLRNLQDAAQHIERSTQAVRAGAPAS